MRQHEELDTLIDEYLRRAWNMSPTSREAADRCLVVFADMDEDLVRARVDKVYEGTERPVGLYRRAFLAELLKDPLWSCHKEYDHASWHNDLERSLREELGASVKICASRTPGAFWRAKRVQTTPDVMCSRWNREIAGAGEPHCNTRQDVEGAVRSYRALSRVEHVEDGHPPLVWVPPNEHTLEPPRHIAALVSSVYGRPRDRSNRPRL